MLKKSSLAPAVLVLAFPAAVGATPKYNPFTYSYSTLGEGEIELEQYVDFVPLKGLLGSRDPQWYGATQFQTEFEYGITDRLELGLYVSYVPTPAGVAFAAETTEANGIKQRL